MTDPAERLAAAVDARRDELIALTQDLVRIPSLNPPGELYRDVCEYLERRLSKQGFTCTFVRGEGAPGDTDAHPRWNVIARKEGARSGPCLHFNSHVDVVEVGQGWTRDPFGGALDDGKIYGRGACDMKGGLATSIIAAEAFAAVCPDYHGAIEISGTADEESGGYAGVAYLAERGWFSPDRVQHVIIPEPLHKDRICLGHRGVWWAELETMGRIAHGSMPFLGTCAVRHMANVIAELEATVYPELLKRKTNTPVIPNGARWPTLNLNSLHGGPDEKALGETGLPTPNVPDRCRLVFDRRTIWEEDMEEVKAELIAAVERVKARRDDFDYKLRELFVVYPTMAPEDSPIVTTLQRAIKTVLNTEAGFVVSPGSYDQKHVDRIGKLRNCVAYGPGILNLAHQPDEYIRVDDMLDGAKVMALSLRDLLLPPQ